jgi:hypothetical protein
LYISSNVIQKRNEHDLVEDLKSELLMYKHNENILNVISKDISKSESIKISLGKIYKNLYNNNIIKKNDIDILNLWLTHF